LAKRPRYRRVAREFWKQMWPPTIQSFWAAVLGGIPVVAWIANLPGWAVLALLVPVVLVMPLIPIVIGAISDTLLGDADPDPEPSHPTGLVHAPLADEAMGATSIGAESISTNMRGDIGGDMVGRDKNTTINNIHPPGQVASAPRVIGWSRDRTGFLSINNPNSQEYFRIYLAWDEGSGRADSGRRVEFSWPEGRRKKLLNGECGVANIMVVEPTKHLIHRDFWTGDTFVRKNVDMTAYYRRLQEKKLAHVQIGKEVVKRMIGQVYSLNVGIYQDDRDPWYGRLKYRVNDQYQLELHLEQITPVQSLLGSQALRTSWLKGDG